MELRTFLQGMALLDQRFRQGKTTAKATVDIYFDHLKRIPDPAWQWICENAIDDYKTFPAPGELRSLWYEWQRQYPEKIAKPDKTDCNECWSTGYLWARKPVPDLSTPQKPYLQTTMFICAKCNNSQGVPAGVRRVTRLQLELEDYELELLGDDFEDPEDAKRNFLESARAIFKPVPQPLNVVDLERRRQEQKRRLAREVPS